MLNIEKSMFISEFFGKKNDQEYWSKKIHLQGKQKGYKMLLVGNASTSGMDKIHTQNEYENAMERHVELNKKP